MLFHVIIYSSTIFTVLFYYFNNFFPVNTIRRLGLKKPTPKIRAFHSDILYIYIKRNNCRFLKNTYIGKINKLRRLSIFR